MFILLSLLYHIVLNINYIKNLELFSFMYKYIYKEI